MGRSLTGSMPTILAGAKRDIDYTIDLTVGSDEFHYATSILTAINGHDYQNCLEEVGQIRQTLESPTDLVAVRIQNLNSDLGWHISANWQAWRKAEAVIGRVYYQINANTNVRTGTKQWIELFRGSVQQPNVDDFAVAFDVIPDTTSPGQIVCNRTCGALCGFVVNDPKTCGLTGATCNHHLKSKQGCDGNGNSHRFGGTEDRYQPTVVVPGTGGNDPGDPEDPPCPRKDQYVRVRGANDKVIAKLAGSVTTADWMWHSVMRRFYPVASAETVKDQPIWETRGPRGIRGFSSQRHPVIRDASDHTGTAVEELSAGEYFLAEDENLSLEAVKCRAVRNTGQIGDVVRIEIDAPTEAEKIYCWSDRPDGPFIVCHNTKINPV